MNLDSIGRRYIAYRRDSEEYPNEVQVDKLLLSESESDCMLHEHRIAFARDRWYPITTDTE